jgi:type VI secretion system secreted protein VgrG
LLTRPFRGFAAVVLALVSQSAHAATAPDLGTATQFAVLASSTVTNTGATSVIGDLGVGPGTAIVGFPPGTVTGTIQIANGVTSQAHVDLTTAYNALTSQACDHDLSGMDLGGLTLIPGTYCFTSSAQLTGQLTLVGGAGATFIFKIGSTLTTASASMVLGGARCNVFWQVGSSVTLGTGSQFVGNILAQASITLTTGVALYGRALARTAAVTMDTNLVVPLDCSGADDTPPTLPPDVPPPTDGEPPCCDEAEGITLVSSCVHSAQVSSSGTCASIIFLDPPGGYSLC